MGHAWIWVALGVVAWLGIGFYGACAMARCDPGYRDANFIAAGTAIGPFSLMLAISVAFEWDRRLERFYEGRMFDWADGEKRDKK